MALRFISQLIARAHGVAVPDTAQPAAPRPATPPVAAQPAPAAAPGGNPDPTAAALSAAKTPALTAGAAKDEAEAEAETPVATETPAAAEAPAEAEAPRAPETKTAPQGEGLGPSAALKGVKSNLPQHRIYHALGNSSQMLGCDRELFLINLLIAATLIFLSHSMVVFAVTTPVALLLFLGLHQMGKRDLLLRHVFIRQLHYQHFYQAQARITYTPTKYY